MYIVMTVSTAIVVQSLHLLFVVLHFADQFDFSTPDVIHPSVDNKDDDNHLPILDYTLEIQPGVEMVICSVMTCAVPNH